MKTADQLSQGQRFFNRSSVCVQVGQSTDTAVLKVIADILQALDAGYLTMLILLYLSAAFDSVDNQTLLDRLRISYGINDVFLLWFTSYLLDRQQHARVSSTRSKPSTVLFDVPQGSVLGHILFLLHTAYFLLLIRRHQLQPHTYADDTQIYGFCHPLATSGLVSRVSSCVDDVSCWMSSH